MADTGAEPSNFRRERARDGRAETADNDLMTPKQVAKAFGVDPKTVYRWARAGKLSYTRTLGGVRRFRGPRCERWWPQQRRRRRPLVGAVPDRVLEAWPRGGIVITIR